MDQNKTRTAVQGWKREGAGRKPGSGVSEKVRRAILEQYVSGDASVAAIAGRFGVSSSYPTILAWRRGLKRRAAVDGLALTEDVETPTIATTPDGEIRRLAARGIGASAIAAMLRVPYRDVLRALEGITPPVKPESLPSRKLCTVAWRSFSSPLRNLTSTTRPGFTRLA